MSGEKGSIADTPNFCVYSQVPSIQYPHYLLEKERKRGREGEKGEEWEGEEEEQREEREEREGGKKE